MLAIAGTKNRITDNQEEVIRFQAIILDEPGLFPSLKKRDKFRTLQILHWCSEMMSRARRARIYAVARCNYELSKRQKSVDEANDAEMRDLCKWAGVGFSLGGDPRGFVVHVKLKGGAHNTMGGAEHGYGVPDPC